MSVEDQFKAAVEIIRSLPKNGSFQPPYAMQLTFYSHYKQATSGPCNGSRPSFWDVVGRAKFDAWQALGTLDKEAAMLKYVSEFVATIKQLQENATPEDVKEALSYAEPKHIALFKPLFGEITATNFVEDVREPSANSEDDIEKLDGNYSDAEEKFSDTLSNLDENEERNSPERADIVNERAVSYKNLKNQGINSTSGNQGKRRVGDFHKTQERPIPLGPYVRTSQDPFPTGNFHPTEAQIDGRHPRNQGNSVQPVDNLSYAVVRLQYTMDEVVRRLDKLERTLHEQQTQKLSLFGGVQPHVLIAIFTWPLLVQLSIHYIRRRRMKGLLRLE